MLPLEGISDYVDITSVVNPWQALIVVVFIFAVLIWPSMSAMNSVKRVEKTLTSNNGGSSVKDAMDRIEQTQADHSKKLETLDEHIEWSAAYVKENDALLASLPCRAPRRAEIEDPS